MIAGSTFSTLFAKSLLAVTKPDLLVDAARWPKVTATSTDAQEMLGRETEQLIRDLKAIEDPYGTDVLTLTVLCVYFKRMLANPRVERNLSRNHPDFLRALCSAILEL
jgi:hypothetical protein